LEEALTPRFYCFAKIAKKIITKKYGLLEKLGSRFHVIFGTLKVTLQAFAHERSLCESCERLAEGIDEIRVIFEQPLKKTPPF